MKMAKLKLSLYEFNKQHKLIDRDFEASLLQPGEFSDLHIQIDKKRRK